VNLLKDSINIGALKNQVEPSIINNSKTNPGFKNFRANKVTMSYLYKDREFCLKFL